MKKVIIIFVILLALFLLDRMVGGLFSEIILGSVDRNLNKVFHSQTSVDVSKFSEEDCLSKGGEGG